MGSLSFLFLDDLEGNANIYVAIKSGSTVQEAISEYAIVIGQCLYDHYGVTIMM